MYFPAPRDGRAAEPLEPADEHDGDARAAGPAGAAAGVPVAGRAAVRGRLPVRHVAGARGLRKARRACLHVQGRESDSLLCLTCT